MSIRSAYVTRAWMLSAAKWCFYREAPVLVGSNASYFGKSRDQLRAEEIIQLAFDTRSYDEIPFAVLETEFRIRGEGALIAALVDYMETQ